MAQRTLIQLIDDLTGKAIEDGQGETVSFALDGVAYEIDLTSKSADKLRNSLQEYIAAGRRVGRKSGRPGKRVQVSDAKEIRDWARSHGFDVPARGRIPQDVRDAFDAQS